MAQKEGLPEGTISGPWMPAVINQDVPHYTYYPYANQLMG